MSSKRSMDIYKAVIVSLQIRVNIREMWNLGYNPSYSETKKEYCSIYNPIWGINRVNECSLLKDYILFRDGEQ